MERTTGRSRVMSNVVLRVVVYHALVVAGLVALQRVRPGIIPVQGTPAGQTGLELGLGPGSPVAPSAALAIVSMLGAALLAVPVAWVYVLTRAKRGYQQSVVQTLVVLPMVVAGVVALVKDSLPLAFGLAGIVAAVRFRTALDDSKDAVYVFLATSVGLAAAVDLQVAVVVATVFNATVLLLWHTDFGRTPAALDGHVADKRLRSVMEEMNRTGTFVARIDDEVFQDMSAEQLQVLADRAWRRARRNSPELPDPEGRRESLLRIRTHDGAAIRGDMEPLLAEHLKKWRFGGVVHEPDGTDVLEYIVMLKKGTPPDEVIGRVRSAGGAAVMAVELE